MSVDFQQLQEDVISIKGMLTALSTRLEQPATTAPVDQVLTVQGAADMFNLTEQTIYGLVSARKIPFSKPTGSKLYFSRLELMEWLRANRTATVQEQTQQYDQARAVRQTRRGGSKAA